MALSSKLLFVFCCVPGWQKETAFVCIVIRILPVPSSITLKPDLLDLMRKEKMGQRLWDLTFTYIGSSIGEGTFKVMDCLCVVAF